MASTVKHLRSSTASKRPTASGLAEGQLAINTASGTPGLFLKDSAGAVVKVGPVHVGASAPNAVPAGSAGNSTGELWVNNSATIHGLNYYTGSAFVNLTPSGTATVAGLVELATNAETQTGTDTVRAVTPSGLQSKVSDSTSTTSSTTIASSTAVKAAYDLADAALPKAGGRVTGNLEIGPAGSLSFEGSSDDSFETTLAVVNPTADRTITLPNTTGTVITTGDSGTVTSAMIADLSIVNADINASASIALSKLATGALPSGITVASANIVDGTIVNADISASAAIVDTKLDTISTAGTVSGTAITSGAIETTGSFGITNGAPTIRLTESDGTATHSQTALARNNDKFLLQTRDSTGTTTLSNDYIIPANASGATEHQWRIADTEKLNLNSTGLTVVDDLTISDKIIHAGDTDTAIRFPAANTVTVETNGSERARIDSSGRLLVGTSSSVSQNIATGTITPQLQNASTNQSGSTISSVNYNSGGNPAILALGSSTGGTLATQGVVNNDGKLGRIAFTGSDGTTLLTAAEIIAEVDGTPGADDMPGRLVFSTTADGAATPTERMRIDSTGNIIVENISTTGNGYFKVPVASATKGAWVSLTSSTGLRKHLRFENGDGEVGSISTNASATAYTTSSDYRLKENVVALDGAIDRLNQLPVHRFNFIADPDTVVDGFIAHEAAAVVPECVTGEKDEVNEDGDPVYQGIDQSKVVPLLTAALQEAIAMINALEARIAALEA